MVIVLIFVFPARKDRLVIVGLASARRTMVALVKTLTSARPTTFARSIVTIQREVIVALALPVTN